MTEVAAVKPHLERRFADHRIVFWLELAALRVALVQTLSDGKRISV